MADLNLLPAGDRRLETIEEYRTHTLARLP